MKQHMTASLCLKSQENNGHFTGYASVFGVVDHHGDQVMPGAFSKTLAKINAKAMRKNGTKNGKSNFPKMLWHHDSRYPIGVWHEIREDEHGLFVHGQLLLDLQQGRETYALMQAGVLDGLSIGFRPVKSRRHQSIKGRILEEIDLHEISLVTFASNPEAKIIDVKSEDLEIEDVHDLIDRLDTLGQLLKEGR